jgi:hypothetical protein
MLAHILSLVKTTPIIPVLEPFYAIIQAKRSINP